jgi:hypothetical protein
VGIVLAASMAASLWITRKPAPSPPAPES